jgi:CheY-like chemotaxis protein
VHALVLALHEDDENSQQVAGSLQLSGHNVILSKDFTHAINILKTKHVDLIISDVHLENGGNVFDFLRWVKKNPSTSATPFIMFSSRPSPMAKFVEDGVKTAARVLGAAMFITMEIFDSDEFRKQIDSLLPVEDRKTTKLSTKGSGE